jgi:hypothetical protein
VFVQRKGAAVQAENRKIKAELKRITDGLLQDIVSMKRQVRPLIPALHHLLRLHGVGGATGHTVALPGPELVRKSRPNSVSSKGKTTASVGSSSCAPHGNVMRTPLGLRDEDKSPNFGVLFANLQSVVANLDALNIKMNPASTLQSCSPSRSGMEEE